MLFTLLQVSLLALAVFVTYMLFPRKPKETVQVPRERVYGLNSPSQYAAGRAPSPLQQRRAHQFAEENRPAPLPHELLRY
jgi:hypothetical protein